jgi:antitoxin ParD1/3/4
MTVKPTISLTDQSYAFAKGLVAEGRFASVSAVIQHGLDLVSREHDLHRARLEAIRQDLEHRAQGPFVAPEEIDEALARWRAERDASDDSSLA